MGTKPTIAVTDVIRDIRSGMDDSAIMHKYRISSLGLASLFRKLVDHGCMEKTELEKRMSAGAAAVSGSHAAVPSKEKTARISPAALLRDLRAGIHDFDLMEKYHLSPNGLQSAVDQLVAAGLIEQSELDSRMSVRDRPGNGAAAETSSSGEGKASSRREDEVIELTWECPVCGIYQSRAYARCPECGALVALLKRNQAS